MTASCSLVSHPFPAKSHCDAGSCGPCRWGGPRSFGHSALHNVELSGAQYGIVGVVSAIICQSQHCFVSKLNIASQCSKAPYAGLFVSQGAVQGPKKPCKLSLFVHCFSLVIALVVMAASNLESNRVLCKPKAAKYANVLQLGNVHCLTLHWNKSWDTQRSGVECCTEANSISEVCTALLKHRKMLQESEFCLILLCKQCALISLRIVSANANYLVRS